VITDKVLRAATELPAHIFNMSDATRIHGKTFQPALRTAAIAIPAGGKIAVA
jgi:hypothetical protein